jgi:hypothetical protein
MILGRGRTEEAEKKKSRALSRAAISKGYLFDNGLNRLIHRNRILEPVEDVIRGVLKTGVRLVELASRLGGELTQLVAVRHVRESSKNKI